MYTQHCISRVVFLAALLPAACWARVASASFIPVRGGPTYDQTTMTGYGSSPTLSVQTGTPFFGDAAVGSVDKRIAGSYVGHYPVRWDASGNPYMIDADAVFVRPGPRLVDGIEALAGILHPSLVEPRPELAVKITPDPNRSSE